MRARQHSRIGRRAHATVTEMRKRKVFLHLAAPVVGSEVRKLVRELAGLAGVARVVLPSPRAPRLVAIDYDPDVTDPRALVSYARRGWTAARLVGHIADYNSETLPPGPNRLPLLMSALVQKRIRMSSPKFNAKARTSTTASCAAGCGSGAASRRSPWGAVGS
jgi:hypothetical protein